MFSWVQNPVCRKIFNANGLGCSAPAATPPIIPLHVLYPHSPLPTARMPGNFHLKEFASIIIELLKKKKKNHNLRWLKSIDICTFRHD